MANLSRLIVDELSTVDAKTFQDLCSNIPVNVVISAKSGKSALGAANASQTLNNYRTLKDWWHIVFGHDLNDSLPSIEQLHAMSPKEQQALIDDVKAAADRAYRCNPPSSGPDALARSDVPETKGSSDPW